MAGRPQFGESEWGAISAVDGRDARMADDLRPHVSEWGLMKNRARVEAAWILKLVGVVPGIDPLPGQAVAELESLASGAAFTDTDMSVIKAYERKGVGDIPATNHDVKALEYALRDRFKAVDEGSAFENLSS
jgi:adenylosuccinate lyase